MTDFPPERVESQTEAMRFRSGVSEALMQSLGASTNFQNYFAHQKFDFKLFGFYAPQATPFYFDGLDVFEFNSAIIDTWAWVDIAGSSGTTTFDVEIEATPGAGWTSIFTTKPAISYNAAGSGNQVWVGVVNSTLIGPSFTYPAYTAPTNTVRPVLNTSVVNSISAFTAMRAKLTTLQGGTPKNCGIMVRVRNI
jgi:hypothetical protein